MKRAWSQQPTVQVHAHIPVSCPFPLPDEGLCSSFSTVYVALLVFGETFRFVATGSHFPKLGRNKNNTPLSYQIKLWIWVVRVWRLLTVCALIWRFLHLSVPLETQTAWLLYFVFTADILTCNRKSTGVTSVSKSTNTTVYILLQVLNSEC